MADSDDANQTRKLETRVPVPLYACLEQLVGIGIYGTTTAAVARFLITQSIQGMITDKLISPPSADPPKKG